MSSGSGSNIGVTCVNRSNLHGALCTESLGQGWSLCTYLEARMSLESGRLSATGIGHRIPLPLWTIWSSNRPSLSVIISHLSSSLQLIKPNYHFFLYLPLPDFYYISFPRDRLNSKLLVYGVYLVECIQTALVTHDALRYFGSGFGDLQNLDRVQWLWIDTPILSGVGKWLRGLSNAQCSEG